MIEIHPIDENAWSSAAADFGDLGLGQFLPFARAAAIDDRATIETVEFRAGNERVGLAIARLKRLGPGGPGIAYIAGGPLVATRDTSLLESILGSARQHYVDERRLLLRVAPSPRHPPDGADDAFAAAGFVASPYAPAATRIVHLAQPLEAIRAGLAGKWRNCLNAAERSDVHLDASGDDEGYAAFTSLHSSLERTKGFSAARGAAFYERLHHRPGASAALRLAVATVDGRPVAGHLGCLLGGTATWLLGAADETGRKTRAAYLLQWDFIEAARDHGCTAYDLGGIDPLDNPGVCRFKQRMGGTERRGRAWEARPGLVRSLVVRGGERVYRTLRRGRTEAR